MIKSTILDILKSHNTVFSFKEILLAFSENNPTLLRRRLCYYVQNKQLYGIRRGLYAKDQNYNKLELATKIFIPSYVSFETVLADAGIVFQHYSQIFVATYQTKEIDCDGKIFSFKKLKSDILNNNFGIENKNYYSIATKERAFLDVVYLNKDYHFDNLSPLEWDKVFSILPVYSNKKMIKRVNKYYENFKTTIKKTYPISHLKQHATPGATCTISYSIDRKQSNVLSEKWDYCDRDERFMRIAIELADQALSEGEVPVGAIVVKDGIIVGRGYNLNIKRNDPTAHAEIVALREAGKFINNYRIVNADLYVTVEPCIMCIGAILQSRISRVIYGTKDSRYGAFNALGILNQINRGVFNHKIEVKCMEGEIEKQCKERISLFFKNKR